MNKPVVKKAGKVSDVNERFSRLTALSQGNLLKGIDNCLDAARSVIQVHLKALDNSFSYSNKFSLFQLKSIKKVNKKVSHVKKNHKNAKGHPSYELSI